MTNKKKTGPKLIAELPILCSNGLFKVVRLTRKRAQNIFCTQCLGFETHPEDCTSVFCPHYPFRKRTLACHEGTMTRDEAFKWLDDHKTPATPDPF